MTVFDLLFLLSFFTAAGTLLAALVARIRGRGARALQLVRRVGIGAAVYAVALVLVSVLSPQRRIAIGDDQCSDDWCIAVQSVRQDTVSDGPRYEVTLRLSSRARRVAQRERFVTVYLRDQRGRRYDPVAEPAAVPFDTLLQPGQAIPAVRRFVLPRGAEVAGLVVAREGGGRFPGLLIIGDENSLLHQRTIVRLD